MVEAKKKRSLKEIEAEVFTGRFRSKDDLIYYLRYEGKSRAPCNQSVVQRYLPPSDLVTKDFLRKVFRGEKRLYKLNEVKRIEVPMYEELSVDSLMKAYGQDEKFRSYLPDIVAKGKKQSREYMFNIFNTIYPHTLYEIIFNARKARNDTAEKAAE